MRQPKLPRYDIRDYLFESVGDARARNLVWVANDQTSHSTLTVGNTQTVLAENLGRVKSVQLSSSVAAVSALTVQIQVNDRDIFEDALRPSIAAGATLSSKVDVVPTDRYIRGETIDSIIEVVDATQTGTLTVLLETEPYRLERRVQIRQPSAYERLTKRAEHAANIPPPAKRTHLVTETAALTVGPASESLTFAEIAEASKHRQDVGGVVPYQPPNRPRPPKIPPSGR